MTWPEALVWVAAIVVGGPIAAGLLLALLYFGIIGVAIVWIAIQEWWSGR